MKTLLLAAVLLVSGLAHAEVRLDGQAAKDKWADIQVSAQILEDGPNGYKKIQNGNVTCYQTPMGPDELTVMYTCFVN